MDVSAAVVSAEFAGATVVDVFWAATDSVAVVSTGHGGTEQEEEEEETDDDDEDETVG